jgi:hypothetical protein
MFSNTDNCLNINHRVLKSPLVDHPRIQPGNIKRMTRLSFYLPHRYRIPIPICTGLSVVQWLLEPASELVTTRPNVNKELPVAEQEIEGFH